MNCPHGRCRAAVITKKCSDHEIFITKIFFHGIFSSFTKFLDHENLELYGICCIYEKLIYRPPPPPTPPKKTVLLVILQGSQQQSAIPLKRIMKRFLSIRSNLRWIFHSTKMMSLLLQSLISKKMVFNCLKFINSRKGLSIHHSILYNLEGTPLLTMVIP